MLTKLKKFQQNWIEPILSFLQKSITHRLGPNGDLKLLSIVISLIVFLFIRVTIGHVETYTIPVSTLSTKAGIAIMRHTPSEIDVSLKGTIDELRNFDPSKLEIEVEIDSIPKNPVEHIRLSNKHVLGLGKLRVQTFNPPEIIVEYDQEVEMELLLTPPELIGKPLQGDASVQLLTDTVKVRGPQSQLKKLMKRGVLLPTESIDVTGKTQGFIKRVDVLPPDDSGISHVTPMEVNAQVVITIVASQESIYTNMPTPTVTTRISPDIISSTNQPTESITDSTGTQSNAMVIVTDTGLETITAPADKSVLTNSVTSEIEAP